MKTKSAALVLAGIALLISAFEIKSQCSCMRVTPDSSYVEIAFVGTVTGKTEIEKASRYRIRVSETFKGLPEQQATVEILKSHYDCSYSMVENKEYLFMARRDKETGEVWAVGCSFSYENAHQQRQMIEILRWKKNSRNQGGIIVGKVAENLRYDKETQKPSGVDKVFLENEKGEKLETKIENDGFYKFTGLAEGIYKLYIQLPETLTTYGDANGFDWESAVRKNIKISGSEDSIQDFQILPNGIISGRVTDEKGQPVAAIEVHLYQIDDKGEESTADAKKTDLDGNYSFPGLAPGNYFIKVGAKDWFLMPNSKNAAFPLTYFPNSLKKTDAQIIKLEGTRVVDNKDIFLTKLKTRRVTGIAFSENGKPAVGAQISIAIKRQNDGENLRGGNLVVTQTGKNGEFALDLYEDTDYLIEARIWKYLDSVSVDVLYSSKCFFIPKESRIGQIKLILLKGSENCDQDEFGF